MTDKQLPPGLVLWPDDGSADQRIGVLISDIHCTDCSVGNQTADESDWKSFFDELGMALKASITETSEVLLILNGDVVDLLRSDKWAAENVYPWQRDDPGFKATILSIMNEIVERHARDPDEEPVEGQGRVPEEETRSSGFFFYLQKMVWTLKQTTPRVVVIPIAGNHDKELQVVPEAREIYYVQCLGLTRGDLNANYRHWVAEQMGSDPEDTWPLLPFYFADPSLRLFATHGQWRDNTNSRATRHWRCRNGWKPHLWQQEKYRAFSDPCFGDTIASGLLSHFIWSATLAIDRDVIPNAFNRSKGDGIDHILNVLGEMDLYRPSELAVVSLLDEASKLDRRDENNRLLFQTVIGQYHKSLHSWLAHPETFRTAPLSYKLRLYLIRLLSCLHWPSLQIFLMKCMARASDKKEETPYSTLPAFHADYRPLGFHLHAEGHTHMAMETDLRYSSPPEPRNYTYVNLGAWRNSIVPKFEKDTGFRRRSVGRALIVQSGANSDPAGDTYGFTLRDTTSWGDRLDRW